MTPDNTCANCGHFSWKHRDNQGRCRTFVGNPRRKCECKEFIPKEARKVIDRKRFEKDKARFLKREMEKIEMDKPQNHRQRGDSGRNPLKLFKPSDTNTSDVCGCGKSNCIYEPKHKPQNHSPLSKPRLGDTPEELSVSSAMNEKVKSSGTNTSDNHVCSANCDVIGCKATHNTGCAKCQDMHDAIDRHCSHKGEKAK